MKEPIYFDHNATTSAHLEVFKVMEPFYKDVYGNASSLHVKGRQAREAVDEARQEIGDFLQTEPEDIYLHPAGQRPITWQ